MLHPDAPLAKHHRQTNPPSPNYFRFPASKIFSERRLRHVAFDDAQKTANCCAAKALLSKRRHERNTRPLSRRCPSNSHQKTHTVTCLPAFESLGSSGPQACQRAHMFWLLIQLTRRRVFLCGHQLTRYCMSASCCRCAPPSSAISVSSRPLFVPLSECGPSPPRWPCRNM